jgi:hypothetical protein
MIESRMSRMQKPARACPIVGLLLVEGLLVDVYVLLAGGEDAVSL